MIFRYVTSKRGTRVYVYVYVYVLMMKITTMLPMMSHLTGCAVLDQGPDHHSVLGPLLRQAEAKIYVILEGD